jgi:hypothetical protein
MVLPDKPTIPPVDDVVAKPIEPTLVEISMGRVVAAFQLSPLRPVLGSKHTPNRTAAKFARLASALWVFVASPAWAGPAAIAYPDPTLTPGQIRTASRGEICSADTRALRHWDRGRANLIYERYGIARGDRMAYTLDHLEHFPLRLNRQGFPNRLGSDSCFWPAKGAGEHGQILIR